MGFTYENCCRTSRDFSKEKKKKNKFMLVYLCIEFAFGKRIFIDLSVRGIRGKHGKERHRLEVLYRRVTDVTGIYYSL